MPHLPPGASAFRFLGAFVCGGDYPVVADTANNRGSIWRTLPCEGAFLPVGDVIGQPDFDSSSEHRRHTVEHGILCWTMALPFLTIGSPLPMSGNNRVMMWDARIRYPSPQRHITRIFQAEESKDYR
ncbi:MAG: hypothetical protein ACUVSW_15210 [Roseiflexus sp.]